MASDIFLKIHDFAGEDLAHHLDHQLIKLGTDFDRDGDEFNDLIADALKVTEVSEHKHLAGIKYEEALIKHDVDSIGLDFIKLGDGFLKLDEVQHKFDDAFLKFADLFIKFTPSDLNTDQGGIKLSTDFQNLDNDLKVTGDSTIKLGLDFLKLDDTHTENPNATLAALSSDFNNIKGNLSSLGDDFLNIGSDYKLADINLDAIKLNEADALKIDEALHKLGTDDTSVGIDFHKLSDDFLKISQDIAPSEGNQPNESLSLNFAKIVFTSSKDFQQLDADAHKLDFDLKLVGDDSIKLSNLLLPAIQPPGPPDDHGISDSLHQVLQLVHDFSLL